MRMRRAEGSREPGQLGFGRGLMAPPAHGRARQRSAGAARPAMRGRRRLPRPGQALHRQRVVIDPAAAPALGLEPPRAERHADLVERRAALDLPAGASLRGRRRSRVARFWNFGVLRSVEASGCTTAQHFSIAGVQLASRRSRTPEHSPTRNHALARLVAEVARRVAVGAADVASIAASALLPA